MSKTFPKLAKLITIAAKEGGTDPESNSKLRTAIANAKAENMPKDNIATAIKRADGRDATNYAEVNYEAKGPHGVMLYIECATDNTNRTVANVKTHLSKLGGEMVQGGQLDFLFNRKTVLEFDKGEGMDLEEVELELIDHGLEELTENEGRVWVYGEFTSFGPLTAAVEAMEIEGVKASLQRIPTSPVEFSEAQMEEIEKLIDRLEDDEDVQAVYTNIA